MQPRNLKLPNLDSEQHTHRRPKFQDAHRALSSLRLQIIEARSFYWRLGPWGRLASPAARGQDSLTRHDPCDVAAVLASKPPTKKRRLVLSRCSLLFAEMLRDQIVASCQAEARQKLTVNKAAPSPITITSSASLLSRWHHLQRQAGMQSSDLRLFKAGQPGSQKRFNTTTTRKTHQRSPQLPIVCKVQ